MFDDSTHVDYDWFLLMVVDFIIVGYGGHDAHVDYGSPCWLRDIVPISLCLLVLSDIENVLKKDYIHDMVTLMKDYVLDIVTLMKGYVRLNTMWLLSLQNFVKEFCSWIDISQYHVPQRISYFDYGIMVDHDQLWLIMIKYLQVMIKEDLIWSTL